MTTLKLENVLSATAERLNFTALALENVVTTPDDFLDYLIELQFFIDEVKKVDVEGGK